MFIDGFAGPGIYSKGEDGSPIIALKTAVSHPQSATFNEIVFLFIEEDSKRFKILQETISRKHPSLPKKFKCDLRCGEFAPTIENLLNERNSKGEATPPTLVFIDPFGYSGMPMELVARLLSNSKTEVLINFMSGFMVRFTDEQRAEVLNAVFGTEDWRKVKEIKEFHKREQFLVELYTRQLKAAAGATYVRTFEMRNEKDMPEYHLIFGTKNIKGLEVMKEAMFKVDRRGMYRFSDRTDPGQTYMLDYSNEDSELTQAATLMYNKFRGKTVPMHKIREYIIGETPWRFRKEILKQLEKASPSKIANVTNRKKASSFPDNCEVTFTK
jgi:three-Cys-motif partner protein